MLGFLCHQPDGMLLTTETFARSCSHHLHLYTIA